MESRAADGCEPPLALRHDRRQPGTWRAAAGGCQEADEIGETGDRGIGDFGIGRRVGLRRYGPPLHRLPGIARRREAHLEAQRGARELGERRHVCLAAEPPHPAVRRAAHPARNSVMMGALPLLQLEQGCIGHGIDEPQAVERWRSEAPRGSGGRRRFAVEPQRPGLRGQLPPDVLSPCLGELVTARRPIEPRCFEHPLSAHAAAGG